MTTYREPNEALQQFQFLEALHQRAQDAQVLKRSPLFQQVIDDFDARDRKGKAIHNKFLRASDSLDWLQELYEELLDACVYLRGELERRKDERPRG